MSPGRDVAVGLAKVEGFIQREPRDGQPATQRTEIYAGYDAANLYIIFVAFDSEPERIRARMTQRENIDGDDAVTLVLDTFHDERRGYVFQTNPFGVQWDAMLTEGQGLDSSFDTLWHSRGALTEQGYVVWMAIPFKSLRFPPTAKQEWGIIFGRDIPRGQAEQSFWPPVSSRILGHLNQAATLRGMEEISPGRSIQMIPYGTFRSFEVLDPRAAGGPDFVTDLSDADAGLDTKLVLQDWAVLDGTVNPDFSQVESDEPQVTVNQRFEVYFPERRPFFLENAGFFRTPINLVFTRRIADPQLGVRLTGKTGPLAVGAMVMDDQAPGKLAPEGDPLHGERAGFVIGRVSRDVASQSTIGAIYAGRELMGSYNRVGGVDGRIRFDDHWAATWQAVASATRLADGSELSDPAYDVQVDRAGRQFNYSGGYRDIGKDFRTLTGFVRRADLRDTSHFVSYLFRPEGENLISWGPEIFIHSNWDHEGIRLDYDLEASLQWEFTGQTELEVNYRRARERLRPEDFPILPASKDFEVDFWHIEYGTSFADTFNVDGNHRWGKRIHVDTLAGQEPFSADWIGSDVQLGLRPITPLRIDNTYFYTRLVDPRSGSGILSDHIFRTHCNWQFTRELSLRIIVQYEATTTDPDLTRLPTRKNVNGDLLVTYRVNPWTALYVGYNGNGQNIDLVSTPTGRYAVRRDGLINDANQFFVKLSYLLRF